MAPPTTTTTTKGAARAKVGDVVWVTSLDVEKPWPAVVHKRKRGETEIFYLNDSHTDTIEDTERRLFPFVEHFGEMMALSRRIHYSPDNWTGALVDACVRALGSTDRGDAAERVAEASWRTERKLRKLLDLLGIADDPNEDVKAPQLASRNATTQVSVRAKRKRSGPASERRRDANKVPKVDSLLLLSRAAFDADGGVVEAKDDDHHRKDCWSDMTTTPRIASPRKSPFSATTEVNSDSTDSPAASVGA